MLGTFIVGFCLFMAFIDNNKNIKYHQTDPLRKSCSINVGDSVKFLNLDQHPPKNPNTKTHPHSHLRWLVTRCWMSMLCEECSLEMGKYSQHNKGVKDRVSEEGYRDSMCPVKQHSILYYIISKPAHVAQSSQTWFPDHSGKVKTRNRHSAHVFSHGWIKLVIFAFLSLTFSSVVLFLTRWIGLHLELMKLCGTETPVRSGYGLRWSTKAVSEITPY